MVIGQRFAAVLSRVARAVIRTEREVCCADLTFQQFETLRMLQVGDATLVGELAEALGIDISTASRNLALLRRRGYITRRKGRDDARKVLFALSRKGRACVSSLCCDERVVFAALLARVPAKERPRVVQALEFLDAALAHPNHPNQTLACCPPGVCTPRNRNAGAR